MARSYKVFMIGVAMLVAAPLSAQRVADLAWLAGTWASESNGSWTEERWSEPRAETMLGSSLGGQGSRAGDFEFLRIAPAADGTLTYYAQPGGRPAIPFRLTRADRNSASFENARHDYPQRITYRRQGDRLTATISLIDGSRPNSWTYRRR